MVSIIVLHFLGHSEYTKNGFQWQHGTTCRRYIESACTKLSAERWMCWDLFSLTNPVGSILVSATTSCKWPVYILHFGQPLTGNTTATLNRELQWTATAAKTSLQKWIRAASNFIALISSMSIGQKNVGSFFLELNSKKLYRSSGRRKESRSRIFMSFSRRSGAVTAMQCTKKRDTRAKLLFC